MTWLEPTMSSLQQKIINKTEEIETINLDEIRCSRCNRVLKSDKSIARGMGKICSDNDAYEKNRSDPKLFLTNKQQNNILRYVKKYINTKKTSLLETTNDTFNYIWGLTRDSSWYKGNTSYYKKYEIKKIKSLLKINI